MLVRVPLMAWIALAAFATAQVQDSVFDVRHLAAREDSEPFAVLLPLQRAYARADLGREGREVPRARALELDQLAELLRFELTRRAPGSAIEVKVGDGVLRVRGEGLAEGLPAAVLAELSAEILRTATIRIHRLPSDFDLAGSAQEVTDRVSDLDPGQRPLLGLAQVPAGAVRRIGIEQRQRFVGRVEIEVASGAKIGDPVPLDLMTGESFLVQALPLRDGRWVLRAAGGTSSVQGFAVRRPAGEDIGRLSLPIVDAATGSAAGVVLPGAGLALRFQTPEGTQTYWLALEASTVAPRPAPALAVWPLGLAVPAPPLLAATLGEGPPTVLPGVRFLETELLVEDLRRADPEGFRGRERLYWAFGRHLAVSQPEAAMRALQDALDARLAPLAQSFSVELTVVQVAAHDLEALQQGLASGLVEAPIASAWTSSVLPGEPFAAALGRERAVVSDLVVEIAQEAALSAPEITAHFEGLALSGRIAASSDAMVDLDLDLVWKRAAAPRLGEAARGEIDALEDSRWRLGIAQRVALGSRVIVAVAPSHAEAEECVALIARIARR